MTDLKMPVGTWPIVCAPTFVVRCGCGWATDSAEATMEEATNAAGKVHLKCARPGLTAAPADYLSHQLYVEHSAVCPICRPHFEAIRAANANRP